MVTTNADVTPGDTPYARRQWIKYQLNLRGLSVSAFSQRLGYDRHTVTVAMHRVYPKAQRAIAAELNVPVHMLWPEWYGPDGERLQQHGRQASKRRAA